ncbi:DUF4132 domain-containing protein [Caballeronia sp. S22]
MQVRLELRRMFDRWLSRSRHMPPSIGQDEMVDELSLLDLSEHYRLEYPGAADDIAKIWDESIQRIADGGPSFDDLVRLGWVYFDGARWIVQHTPLGTSPHITYPSPSTKTFLTTLSKARLVAKSETPPPDAQALAARMLAEDWFDRQFLGNKTSGWLAGRMWQRLCPKPLTRASDDYGNALYAVSSIESDGGNSAALQEAEAEAIDSAFLEWSAWCNVLGTAGRWDNNWKPIEMRYCREAAHRVLQRQSLWRGWNDDVERYKEELENTFAIPEDRLRYFRQPRTAPPRTLVSLVDWLKWPEVEHLMMGRLGANSVSFAFGVLCSELEKTDIGPGITDAASTVLTFAADHPMALQQFLFRVDAVPALLVDMLMHRRAACLAAKLAIEWQPKSGRPSDRSVSREAQTKAFAVQDALSLLAYQLDEGTLDLEECASLVTWCYAGGAGSMRAVADSRSLVGRQLLGMVSRQEEELQYAVLTHLVDQAAYEDNVPRARFAGVLEGLNCLSAAPRIDAFPIVALYSKFARDLHLDWTDASDLPAELAARLIATAFAQAASDRDALLIPFDNAKLLRETPEDERLSLSASIAQTLRRHVRLLARAMAGWRDEVVPTELCDALQALISRSVIEHAEKGRVGALTDRYSPRRFLGREEGSPAQDLTSAWRRLDDSRKEAMLQAFARSDDPVLLAELCQHLPATAKPGIQARLRQLKPGEASTLWTWPELQNRIESLLAAGEFGLAREHLDEARQDLERAPAQYRLGLFGVGLQLLLKEKNWTALDAAIVPPTLDEAATRQAQDTLDFYRATSQLLRPDGNLAGARLVLERLAGRPGAASAYKENVFAIAIQQLMGPTLHPLAAADKVTGESLLAEINLAVNANEKLASSSLLANRALLLLALERPEDSLESVAARRREKRSPDLEVMVVLAKFEMGFKGEAMAILDAAISEFGSDKSLIALKSDLQIGDALPSVLSASVAVDPISSIRAALQQLTELPPSQVGDVLGPPGRGVRGYLVRQVSRAVATLQHMAAMLRDRKNLEDEARFENDLNTAVREVLQASLAVVKWHVADQSLGGSTGSGNPGERDAVIRVAGQEVSIYEALVCSGLDRTYTKKHFDKLLSYGVCDLYFHVTYSYAKKLKPLLDYIRHMLEHEVPPGLIYRGCEILEPPNFETIGYIATYSVERREVAVVFLVADLRL